MAKIIKQRNVWINRKKGNKHKTNKFPRILNKRLKGLNTHPNDQSCSIYTIIYLWNYVSYMPHTIVHVIVLEMPLSNSLEKWGKWKSSHLCAFNSEEVQFLKLWMRKPCLYKKQNEQSAWSHGLLWFIIFSYNVAN